MRRASPLPMPAYQQTTPSPQTRMNGVGPADGKPASSGGSGQSALASAGKTSQVLDRLTAENDRLRREVKAERAAKDELLQQQKALRALMERLEEKNQMLKLQFDTHDSTLARKERKLEDLKAQLEAESARRMRAEEREAEMGRKLGETTAEAAKAVSEAKMRQKQSDGAYNTVQKDYLQLKGRVEALTLDFNSWRKVADQDRQEKQTRFVQLEVLLDQKRQAMEQATKVNREQAKMISNYREEMQEAETRKQEMIETTNKMKWLMGLHKTRQSNPTASLCKKEGEAEEDEDSS